MKSTPTTPRGCYARLRNQPNGDRIIAALDAIKKTMLRNNIKRHRAAHPLAQKLERVK